MSRDPMIAIKAAITRFDTASQDYAFVGSQEPEDRPAIEKQHQLARESLERLIAGAIRRSMT